MVTSATTDGLVSVYGMRLHFPLLYAVALICLSSCGTADESNPASDRGAAAIDRLVVITDQTGNAGLAGFRHHTGGFGERWFPESMGGGCGFVDFDGDGLLDIILISGGNWPGRGEDLPVVTVFRNAGDGSFQDATADVGLAGTTGYGMGISSADYDNDGDADLYVSTTDRDLLFRNEGGRFVESGLESGIVADEEWMMSSMFFDADRDGWLDLLVVGYVEWTPETDLFCTIDGKNRTYCRPDLYVGQQPRFYHNNRDGTFTEKSEDAGFRPSPGKSLGIAELDFDHDGWVDVLVSNDTQPDQLFHNRGDGTFEEIGLISGIAFDENGNARGGMGIDTGYLDKTGEVSTVVANFAMEMIGVYRHMGNGLFIDRAAISRIGRPSLLTLAFSVFLVDFDLDSDLDLFAANGHIHPEVEQTIEGITYAQAPHLFLNGSEGEFVDVSKDVGGVLGEPIVARGAAYGDFDNDGDPDLLVVENDGPVHLWRNELTDATFLKIRLEGNPSNRDGFGAQVSVSIGEDRMIRRVRSGSSYLSASEPAVIFGLNGATQADELEIRWPSGAVETWSDVQGNQTITLIEGSGQPSE